MPITKIHLKRKSTDRLSVCGIWIDANFILPGQTPAPEAKAAHRTKMMARVLG
jgi:hypothetical protein